MEARPNVARCSVTESKNQNQMETLVVEHDIEERTMHVQYAIPA